MLSGPSKVGLPLTFLMQQIFSLQSEKYKDEDCWKEMFSFTVETIESAIKSWHETSKVDARVYFLLDKEKTQTDKYAPVVNIDKVLTFFLLWFCKIFQVAIHGTYVLDFLYIKYWPIRALRFFSFVILKLLILFMMPGIWITPYTQQLLFIS